MAACTIGLVRSWPVRLITGGDSKILRTVPPRTGGGSTRSRTSLVRLQNGPDDVQVNQGAHEPSGDQGQHISAASARGSTTDNVSLKDHGLEEPQHSCVSARLWQDAKGFSLAEGPTARGIQEALS